MGGISHDSHFSINTYLLCFFTNVIAGPDAPKHTKSASGKL